MKKIELVQALCDHFEIDLGEYGGYVNEENLEEIINSYDFISGACIYGKWIWITLKEVFLALEPLCDPDDWD